MAIEEQPEAEKQNNDGDDEETPRHRGANFQDEELQQLADAFEHQQRTEQLGDILHDLVGVPKQDETKEACVCDAKDETNGVMHNGGIVFWLVFRQIDAANIGYFLQKSKIFENNLSFLFVVLKNTLSLHRF